MTIARQALCASLALPRARSLTTPAHFRSALTDTNLEPRIHTPLPKHYSLTYNTTGSPTVSTRTTLQCYITNRLLIAAPRKMAPPTSTIHSILKLPKSATRNQINKAYKKAARAAHPDKGGNNKAMAAVSLDCIINLMKHLTDFAVAQRR